MIDNFEAAARRIAEIRELGVQIALDDFGTGYSSLEYLSQLSFDLIKIDKSFIDDVHDDGRKLSMVKIICVLAKSLGAKICVEGIEKDEQATLMSTLNVAYGQGFFFSKPIPESDVPQMVGGTLPV